jgi:hypothetical protein
MPFALGRFLIFAKPRGEAGSSAAIVAVTLLIRFWTVIVTWLEERWRRR